MNFEDFKKLHSTFSKLGMTYQEMESLGYERYIDEMHSNIEFYRWTIKDKLEKQGFEYESYCCLELAKRVFDSLDEQGEIKYDDPDVVINKWKDGTFGIPIHDGGTSIITIKFCPWCGSDLKIKIAANTK
jgi:hypothetical protein